MSTRTALTAYCGWMAALIAVFFAVPAAQLVTASAVSLSCAGVIAAGVRGNRPARPGAWLSFAAAIVLSAMVRVIYDLLPGPEGTLKPGTFVTYPLYLMSFVLILVGLVGLVRHPGPTDWAEIVDLTILALAAGLLTYLFLIAPLGGTEAARQGGDLFPSLFPTLFPISDVLVLTATIRFAISVRLSLSAALVTVAMSAITLNNVAFWVGNTQGVWLWGQPTELLWMSALTALGVAALHPSMAAVSAAPTGPYRSREASTGRLALLAVGSLIPPAIMMTEALHGHVFGPFLVAVSALMLTLVLVRLATVAYRLRQQAAREQSLQEAIADLVAASDLAAVQHSLDYSVRRLLPSGGSCRLVVLTPDTHGPHLAQMYASHPHLLRPVMLNPAELAPGVTASLTGTSSVLACPLRHNGSGDERQVGLLLIAADAARLATLQPAIETLSAAATLALERIRLSQEVIRTASDRYFRALVHNAADVIMVLDDDDRVRYVSPAVVSLFGTRGVVGASFADLIQDRTEAVRLLELHRSGGGPMACSAWAEHKDWTVNDDAGTPATVEITCRDLHGDPAIQGRVMTLRNVTRQRSLERELARQAFHDPLTGLPNRTLFSHRVGSALDHDRRSGAVTGVFLIDLDDFKLVNDALGHHAGDAYLVAVGRRLTQSLAPQGFAARLGGDEFAALIANAADVAEVNRVAARVVGALNRPIRLGDQGVACSASLGASTTPNAVTSQELMHQADLALYAAKEAGKGRWRQYEPSMHSSMVGRLELRSALEHALVEDALALEYQPIVSLRDDTSHGGPGRVVGVEALLRWHHPTRGRLSPGEFIGVAEDSGLISPIGAWVLETAIQAATQWRSAEPCFVAVNVSARQFQDADLVSTVNGALTRAGLAPDLLILEITESTLLRDDRMWEQLRRLRRTGIRIAIDDFGTGYSALSYLRQVPLDVIKIDRLFISTTADSAQQRAVFEGVVGLARTLGLSVVAEGIETQAERDIAAKAGCRYGQGYFFAAPLPADEVARHLTRHRLPTHVR